MQASDTRDTALPLDDSICRPVRLMSAMPVVAVSDATFLALSTSASVFSRVALRLTAAWQLGELSRPSSRTPERLRQDDADSRVGGSFTVSSNSHMRLRPVAFQRPPLG